MPPSEETAELVKAAQRGDQDAFAALFGEYQQPVLGYVYHTVHDRAAAEDVTQDAFIRAHQAPASASATASITAIQTQTLTGSPTHSPTVTASATLEPPVIEATSNSNCRAGPSNQYSVTGLLLTGERARVDGKNSAGTWWWIEKPSGSGHCYVWDGLVDKSGDFSQVPVVPDPPTPTPDSPPSVSISHSPTGSNRPRSNETVSFNATASDDIGVAALEIWIDSPAAGGFSLVQSCSNATTCAYVGGPYSAGQFSYYARATDSGGSATTSSTTTITIFGPAQ